VWKWEQQRSSIFAGNFWTESFWKNDKNVAQYLRYLKDELGVKVSEDWYKIPGDILKELNDAYLDPFAKGLVRLLCRVYPGSILYL
jgi:hypothetical protein